MCKITLIRHGQASFGAPNYDLLSGIGRLQAAAVGDFFNTCSTPIERIVHGEMLRQSETAQIIATTIGISQPLEKNPALNEFDSDNLIKHYLPKVIQSLREQGQMIEDEDWFQTEEIFIQVYHALINRWQLDHNCPFESWKMFAARVQLFTASLAELADPNHHLVLVTSGGLISIVLQQIWGLEDNTFSEINLSINNASLSEIKIELDHSEAKNYKIRLLSFNNISPLLLKKDKSYITRK